VFYSHRNINRNPFTLQKHPAFDPGCDLAPRENTKTAQSSLEAWAVYYPPKEITSKKPQY